jgi:hypothetical protein
MKGRGEQGKRKGVRGGERGKKLILLVFSLSHYVVGGSCGEPAKKKQIKFIFSLLAG